MSNGGKGLEKGVKKMKKLTGLLLGIASAACFTAAPMCLSSSEVSAATAENIAFNNNDLYVVEKVVDEMPKSITTVTAYIPLKSLRLNVSR